MSVTDIVEKYKEGFDPYRILKNGKRLIDNYVEKNGGTPEYWLKKWEQKAKASRDAGNLFHTKLDYGDVIGRKIKYRNKNFEYLDYNAVAKKRTPIRELPDGVYTEFPIFDRKYMISARVDRLVKDGNYVDIYDNKTGKLFNKKPHNKKKMKSPADVYDDCHLGHYSLQLNLYAWMFQEQGMIPRRLAVRYFKLSDLDIDKIIKGHATILELRVKPTIFDIVPNLLTASRVIKHNNYSRGSKRSDMYLL